MQTFTFQMWLRPDHGDQGLNKYTSTPPEDTCKLIWQLIPFVDFVKKFPIYFM